MDAPANKQLTSLNIDSATGIFAGAQPPFPWLASPVDNFYHKNLFKATFGSSFGSISFGNVARPHLSDTFLLNDLSVVGSLAGGGGLGPVDLVYLHELYPGDADRNYSFDQLDIVRVLQSGKYLTGEPATWGDGDWNGGPGGYRGAPPPGDGRFDQKDIVAALQAGKYLSGAYAAIRKGGVRGDEQMSIIYDARTGEIAVDRPFGSWWYGISIESAAGIFEDLPARTYDEFDVSDEYTFQWASLAQCFGDLSFGNVAQPGLSEDFVINDLTVGGSLCGGGGLGDVDLIYVPEPSVLLLAMMGITGLVAFFSRRASRVAPFTLAIALLATTVPSVYAELLPNGVLYDEQTSIVYYPETGELAIGAPGAGS